MQGLAACKMYLKPCDVGEVAPSFHVTDLAPHILAVDAMGIDLYINDIISTNTQYSQKTRESINSKRTSRVGRALNSGLRSSPIQAEEGPFQGDFRRRRRGWPCSRAGQKEEPREGAGVEN